MLYLELGGDACSLTTANGRDGFSFAFLASKASQLAAISDVPGTYLPAVYAMSGPNKKHDPTLMGLPAELRNRIYELVLAAEQSADTMDLGRRVDHGSVRPRYRFQPRNPNLMRVNGTAGEEAGSMFFGQRAMHIGTQLETLPALVNYLRRSRRDIARARPFGSLTIDVTDTAWERLEEILPLLEYFRMSDFEIHDHLHLLSRGSETTPLGLVLQGAIALALEGRRFGWSEPRLQREVHAWAVAVQSSDEAVAASNWRENAKKPRWQDGRRTH